MNQHITHWSVICKINLKRRINQESLIISLAYSSCGNLSKYRWYHSLTDILEYTESNIISYKWILSILFNICYEIYTGILIDISSDFFPNILNSISLFLNNKNKTIGFVSKSFTSFFMKNRCHLIQDDMILWRILVNVLDGFKVSYQSHDFAGLIFLSSTLKL